jgi:hypothetical protein
MDIWDILALLKPIVFILIFLFLLVGIIIYFKLRPINIDCNCAEPSNNFFFKCKEGTKRGSSRCQDLRNNELKSIEVLQKANNLYGSVIDTTDAISKRYFEVVNAIINMLIIEDRGALLENNNGNFNFVQKRIGKIPYDSIHWIYSMRDKTIRSSIDTTLLLTINNNNVALQKDNNNNRIKWDYDEDGYLKVENEERYVRRDNNNLIITNKKEATLFNIRNILSVFELSNLIDLLSTLKLPDLIIDLEEIKNHVRACLSADSLISVDNKCIPVITTPMDVNFENKNYKCCVPLQPFKCMIKGAKEGISNGRVCLPVLTKQNILDTGIGRFNLDLAIIKLNVDFPNLRLETIPPPPAINVLRFGTSYISFEYFNKVNGALIPLQYVCGEIVCMMDFKVDLGPCSVYSKRFELYTLNSGWNLSKDRECCCSPSLKEIIEFFKELFSREFWDNNKGRVKFSINEKGIDIQIPLPKVGNECIGISVFNGALGLVPLDGKTCAMVLNSNKILQIFGDFKICVPSLTKESLGIFNTNINVGGFSLSSNFPNLEVRLDKSFFKLRYYNVTNNNVTPLTYLCGKIKCELEIYLDINPCTQYSKKIDLFELDPGTTSEFKNGFNCCCGPNIDDIIKMIQNMFDLQGFWTTVLNRRIKLIDIQLVPFNILLNIPLPKFGNISFRVFNNFAVLEQLTNEINLLKINTEKLRSIFGDFKICTPVVRLPDGPNILGTQFVWDQSNTNFCNKYKASLVGPLGIIDGPQIDISNVLSFENRGAIQCCCGPTVDAIQKDLDNGANCLASNFTNPSLGNIRYGKIGDRCIIPNSSIEGDCCKTSIGNIVTSGLAEIKKGLDQIAGQVVSGIAYLGGNDSPILNPTGTFNCIAQDCENQNKCALRLRMEPCTKEYAQKFELNLANGTITNIGNNPHKNNCIACYNWNGQNMCTSVDCGSRTKFEYIKDTKQLKVVENPAQSNLVGKCLGLIPNNGLGNRGPFPVDCNSNDEFQRWVIPKAIYFKDITPFGFMFGSWIGGDIRVQRIVRFIDSNKEEIQVAMVKDGLTVKMVRTDNKDVGRYYDGELNQFDFNKWDTYSKAASGGYGFKQ